MSAPTEQPKDSAAALAKPISKKRREHPLFLTNDAVKSARLHAAECQLQGAPLSRVHPPAKLIAARKKGKRAASRPDTHTNKGAPTFSTSGSPCVDLFFSGLVRGCETSKLHSLLNLAWQASPRTTLQLIAHSRDCRDGKGERLVSLHSLLFLRAHKPLHYLSNLLTFLRCGCFKDLLQLARMAEKAQQPRLGERELIELEVMAEFIQYDGAQLDKREKREAGQDGKEERKEAKEAADEDGDDDYVLIEEVGKLSVTDESKESETDEGKTEQAAAHKNAEKPAKRRAPRMFISLAGKWAPSEDSHFDQAPSRFAHRLARLLFPDAPRPMPQYRKLLGRLRTHLQVVEKQMCAGEWAWVEYERIPSRAHKLLKDAFLKHDAYRYGVYLEAVKKGEKKLNVTGLQPHELTAKYRQNLAHDETTELQWAALVERTKASSGRLSNAIAVVDVSGSMQSGRGSVQPIEPAIALGLLISSVATGAFHQRVITFQDKPAFWELPSSSLHAQVRRLQQAPWGNTTNLQATFDIILAKARQHHVRAEDMPATLFILSDMQFDAACGTNEDTNFDVARSKYRKAGYAMPSVVFWNLNGAAGGRSDAPVKYTDAGVAMLSGYSGELLRLIMDGASMTPESIMQAAADAYEVMVEDAET